MLTIYNKDSQIRNAIRCGITAERYPLRNHCKGKEEK